MALGPNLRERRESQNLSRERLAEKAGVSVPTIARIELYGVEPRFSTMRALADALDVPVSALVDGDGEEVAS